MVSALDSIPEDDGLMPHTASVLSACLQNSALLLQLDTKHLFTDVPQQTSVLKHDVVGKKSN